MEALGSHPVLSGGADAATAEARLDIAVAWMLTGMGCKLCNFRWPQLYSVLSAARKVVDRKAGRKPSETIKRRSQILMNRRWALYTNTSSDSTIYWDFYNDLEATMIESKISRSKVSMSVAIGSLIKKTPSHVKCLLGRI